MVLVGFNFNHRVGDPFQHEQWSGAKGIADQDIPEIALWWDKMVFIIRCPHAFGTI